MSADGQAGVVKVKAILSNIITVLLCSLAVITVVVAVIAGLHWAACAVPSSATLS